MPRPLQFSLRSLLLLVVLTVVATQGTYAWHHSILWSTDGFGDPTAQSFIDGRQQLYSRFTPFIVAFVLLAVLSIWFSVVGRRQSDSLVAGVCLGFPLLVFLSPLLTVFAPLVTLGVGVWLLVRRAVGLGGIVIGHAVGWLILTYYYVDRFFAAYGD